VDGISTCKKLLPAHRRQQGGTGGSMEVQEAAGRYRRKQRSIGGGGEVLEAVGRYWRR